MSYEIWHIIHIVSGAAAAVFLVLTVIFAVKFRFFELLEFRLRSRSSTPPEIIQRNNDVSSVTEQLSRSGNMNHGGITADGTVIAGKSPSASDSDFVITRNIIVINADPSVIDQI